MGPLEPLQLILHIYFMKFILLVLQKYTSKLVCVENNLKKFTFIIESRLSSGRP